MTSRFSVIQSMYYICAVGIMQAFLMPMYSDFGYSTAQISILVATANMAALVSQPIIGRMLDKKQRINSTLAIILLIGIVAFCAVYFLLDSFMVVVISIFVLYATTGSICYLLDAWAVRLMRHGISMSYATSKTVGSVVYSFFMIAFGKLLDICDFGIMVPSFIASSLVCMVFILGVKDPGFQVSEPTRVDTSSTEGRSSNTCVADTARRLVTEGAQADDTAGRNIDGMADMHKIPAIPIATKKLVFVALSILILFFSCNTVYAFLSLVIKDHGGTNSDYGLAQFLVGAGEATFIFLYDKIAKKASNRDKLLFGIIIGLASVIAISFAPSIPIIIIGAGLYGMFGGIYVVGIANYVPEIIDEKHTYTYCMILASSISAATMLASLYIGKASTAMGLQDSMKLAAVTLIISLVIFAYFTREDRSAEVKTGK